MRKKIIIILILCGMLLGFVGCASEQVVSRSDFALDTVVTITAYGTEDAAVLDPAFKLIRDYDQKWNAFSADSEIEKINQAAGKNPVQVSEETFEIIKASMIYSQLTDGRFDISAGSLIELWGIGEPETKDKPAQSAINEALQKVDYHKIQLDEDAHSVFLIEPGMKLNLGAMAKGYIGSKVKTLLKEQGLDHVLINLGGNIVLIGGKDQRNDFVIGVQDPDESEGEPVGQISAKDKSIVVSGDYQRYFTDAAGKKYHHILDAKKGTPVESGLRSVAVMTDDALKADALSTCLFIMGEEAALQYVNQIPNVECLLITTDHRIVHSSGMREYFEFNQSAKSKQYKYQ